MQIPIPSPGCETCQKRRVRCDGAKPNCQQCQRASRMCIFPAQQPLNFTFVTEDIGSKAKRKRSRQESGAEQLKHRKLAHSSFRPQSEPSPTLALTPSTGDQATAYFFHTHVSSPIDGFDAATEHTALLPQLWMRSSSHSALRLAILAKSQAALGKARGNPIASKESAGLYVRAIAMLKQSLLSPVDAASDEILLATMVLSAYENTIPTPGEQGDFHKHFEVSQHMLGAFHHHDGALALLKIRKQNPAEPNTLNLDKLVRRQLLRSALLRGRGIPDWLEFGELFGESGVLLGLDRHMAQLIKIQRYAKQLKKRYAELSSEDKQLPVEPLSMLIKELVRLDNDMVSWANRLDPEWWYQSYSIREEEPLKSLYGHEIHIYQSLGHAAIWNRHRTVRMILKKVSIELLQLHEEHFNEDSEMPIRTIAGGMRDLINDICASVPFFTSQIALNEFADSDEAFLLKDDPEAKKQLEASMTAHLAFPFHAIVESMPLSEVNLAQRQWIKRQLVSVGQSANDTILENVAHLISPERSERSTTPS